MTTCWCGSSRRERVNKLNLFTAGRPDLSEKGIAEAPGWGAPLGTGYRFDMRSRAF